jgi:nucleoside-diphosphate-sugar epimerase
MVAATIGWSRRIVRADNPSETLPLHWDYHLVTDTNAIRRDLEYSERVSRSNALAETIAWLRR